METIAQTAAAEVQEKLKAFEETQRATLNILEDFGAEKNRLEEGQRATLNILEDFNAEKKRLEQGQRATLNILDDFNAERQRLEQGQRATLNILDDFNAEKVRMERAQVALQQQASLLDLSHDAILVWPLHGPITFWNRGAERVYGFSRDEAIGQVSHDLLHTGTQGGVEAFLQTLEREGRWEGSLEHTRRDGRQIIVESRMVLIRDKEGARVLETNRDVTQRKQNEQRIQELNRELGHKLEALAVVNQELEGFSYSVAHDLRAPLRHVDGFSKILLEDHGAEMKEEARRLLERVRDGAQHMGTLIDELLNFSRLGRREPQRQITGLNSLVEEARAGLRAEGDGRAVEWRVGRLPYADCDPALMKQVFSNLLSNALKFTRPREPAVIEVGQLANNGQTAIFVRDNGVGFDMKYANKLFGVFQRLHRPEDFEGTGVGLALVQKIVQKHGGRIWVEAALDRGATFFFTLGAAEAAPQPAAAQTGGAYGR